MRTPTGAVCVWPGPAGAKAPCALAWLAGRCKPVPRIGKWVPIGAELGSLGSCLGTRRSVPVGSSNRQVGAGRCRLAPGMCKPVPKRPGSATWTPVPVCASRCKPVPRMRKPVPAGSWDAPECAKATWRATWTPCRPVPVQASWHLNLASRCRLAPGMRKSVPKLCERLPVGANRYRESAKPGQPVTWPLSWTPVPASANRYRESASRFRESARMCKSQGAPGVQVPAPVSNGARWYQMVQTGTANQQVLELSWPKRSPLQKPVRRLPMRVNRCRLAPGMYQYWLVRPSLPHPAPHHRQRGRHPCQCAPVPSCRRNRAGVP